MNEYELLLQDLLSHPNKLKTKAPFTRGIEVTNNSGEGRNVASGEKVEAIIPRCTRVQIPQHQFLRELDPASHDVLFDDNIPCFHIKRNDGTSVEIKQERIAIPFQKLIKNKQLMHLTANPMQFTLIDQNPTDTQQNNFIVFKQYWDLRNQDGMKNKMVDTQLSVGDAGLLYYFDRKGCIKSRILAYPDYVLCPHNDQNGDRILESVYYTHPETNVEYIDSYDDTYRYRYTNDAKEGDKTVDGWRWHKPVEHGFNEIPLVTKRGEVAWNNVQSAITAYEADYNILHVSVKKYGYNMLYVKGKFKDDVRKVAGAMILNDTSLEGKGDAKFLQYPKPDGALETLNLMKENIQLGSSTTFLLPDDVKTGGDVAGIAIQLVQSLDLELAHQKVIEWQNVADKMVRLFKYGLAKELVASGKNEFAVTDFEELNINAKFKVWKPLNDEAYNMSVAQMKQMGIISLETAIEMNTYSKPDEKARVRKEMEETERKAQEQLLIEKQATQETNNENNNNGKEDEE